MFVTLDQKARTASNNDTTPKAAAFISHRTAPLPPLRHRIKNNIQHVTTVAHLSDVAGTRRSQPQPPSRVPPEHI